MRTLLVSGFRFGFLRCCCCRRQFILFLLFDNQMSHVSSLSLLGLSSDTTYDTHNTTKSQSIKYITSHHISSSTTSRLFIPAEFCEHTRLRLFSNTVPKTICIPTIYHPNTHTRTQSKVCEHRPTQGRVGVVGYQIMTASHHHHIIAHTSICPRLPSFF